VYWGIHRSGLGESQQWSKQAIPHSGGLESRVVIAGITASTARAIVECPLELIKVRQMTGQPWRANEVFSGFSPLWIRTVGLMTTFFVLIDYSLRYIPDLMNTPGIGPFLKGGVAATVGWAVIWPFENIKNQIQAKAPGPQSQFKRLVWVAQEQGVKGLFRGFLPGAGRSMVANGVSMLVFDWCQGMRKQYLNK
jgi:solute carrier family 25 carnitine/acylcarnitine transporter 20/29